MSDRWYPLYDVGYHNLVASTIKEGQTEAALEGLKGMKRSQIPVQTWLLQMMVFALCDRGELDETMRLVKDRMSTRGPQLSLSTWYYMFDTACGSLHVSRL